MFKKIKDGASEAATNAGIEAAYLQGKKSGFHHPPEVEAQITILREVREEIPLLREDISAMLNYEKDLAASETKTATDFVTMSEHSSQHPQLKQIMQLYGAVQTSVASNRYNYHATVEQIKEEWKMMENNDMKDLRVKQDQTNRAWSTKKYWEKEKKSAKVAELDSRYKVFVSELVHIVHDLREKKEELLPGYVLSIVQNEMEFHRKCLEELVKCESSIRGMGRITPNKFTGYDQFAPGVDGSQQSEMGISIPQQQRTSGPNSARAAGPQARALYAFQAQSPDELSFQPNDVLTIVSQTGDWWTAEFNGRQGLIPANYIQIL